MYMRHASKLFYLRLFARKFAFYLNFENRLAVQGDFIKMLNENHNFRVQLIICYLLEISNVRKFLKRDGVNFSTKSFDIIEGLMQGTVNSPIIFIFTHRVPLLFELNKKNGTYSKAPADDFVFLVLDKNSQTELDKMGLLANKISDPCKSCSLQAVT